MLLFIYDGRIFIIDRGTIACFDNRRAWHMLSASYRWLSSARIPIDPDRLVYVRFFDHS